MSNSAFADFRKNANFWIFGVKNGHFWPKIGHFWSKMTNLEMRKLPDSDETEEIDDPTNYNLIFSLFTNMCREEFGIFETNDRRLKFRSPTKKLVKNNICLVLPPSKKNIVNIDEAKKNVPCLWFFDR